jgi:probable rRNA maturation factor
MPEVAFLSKGIAFRFIEARKTSKWLKRIASAEGRKIESLSYVFASDPFVAGLNRKYLRHNTYTDILTFDYSENGPLTAEVYISIARVRENARAFGEPFSRELRRVIVHGLLHLLGYDDTSPRLAARMRRKEEACLSLWS